MDFSSNFMNILAWTFWFFCFFAFMWLLFIVFSDLYGDHEIGGGAKVLWTLVILLLPFIGVLIYLIARGSGMGPRSAAKAEAIHKAQSEYIRSVAGSASPTDQINQAKQMLDAGTITAAEFDAIKAKALS